jgi:glycosyltransferase involved in cell wall biosynthesis
MTGILMVDQLVRPTPGGIGTYIESVLSELKGLGSGEDFVLLHSGRRKPPLVASWPGGSVGTLVGQPFIQRIWDLPLPRPVGSRAFGRAEFFHAFSLAGPMPPKGRPFSFTLYDLLFLKVPDAFTRRGASWHKRRLSMFLKRADAIVVMTDGTAKEVTELGFDPGRVKIIPPGADHLPLANRKAARSLLESHGVTGNYLVCVGTREPRKNLNRLFSAYSHYREATFDPVPLVVVGPKGWGEQGSLPAGAVETGPVAPEILSGLIAESKALVYVSLAEGFGLPVVEALNQAVPVVVSKTVPSSRYGGIPVDPYDEEDIASAIYLAVHNEGARSRLVTQGLMSVSELTWNAVASRYMELWKGLVECAR